MGYGYRGQLADVFQRGCPIGRGRWAGPGAVGDAGAMAGFAVLGGRGTTCYLMKKSCYLVRLLYGHMHNIFVPM
eukprot:scaffold36205_cov67-Attheya_sp.AAC.2